MYARGRDESNGTSCDSGGLSFVFLLKRIELLKCFFILSKLERARDQFFAFSRPSLKKGAPALVDFTENMATSLCSLLSLYMCLLLDLQSVSTQVRIILRPYTTSLADLKLHTAN